MGLSGTFTEVSAPTCFLQEKDLPLCSLQTPSESCFHSAAQTTLPCASCLCFPRAWCPELDAVSELEPRQHGGEGKDGFVHCIQHSYYFCSCVSMSCVSFSVAS